MLPTCLLFISPVHTRSLFRRRISSALPVRSPRRVKGWPNVLLAWIWLASQLSSPAQHSPAAVPDIKFLKEGGVTSIAFQEDGKLVIAGWFTSINGVPRSGLARLNANGSVDTTWTPAVGGYVAAVNGAHVFAVVDEGTINGTSHQRLVKISLSGAGEVDETWNPQIPGLAGVFTMTVAGGRALALRADCFQQPRHAAALQSERHRRRPGGSHVGKQLQGQRFLPLGGWIVCLCWK